MSLSDEEKDRLAGLRADMAEDMNAAMKNLCDKDFIMLLDTVSKIETGPAKLLLMEAAARLAHKTGN